MASTIKLKNGSGAPTSGQLVQGEPAFDLTNKRLYTENASGTVIEVGTNPSSLTTASADINGGTIDGTVIGGSSAAAGSFTTLSASGEIAANGGIALGDNDKATFGASDDLQIYHDGSHSYINDTGTGDLFIKGDNNLWLRSAADENYIRCDTDGAVWLYYDNVNKLTTTSTGIDVTGTVTADGLTVDGDGTVNGELYVQSTNPRLRLKETDTTDVDAQLQCSAGVFKVARLDDSNATADSRLSVDLSSGDISFYEDTGTTAKFFWDASAESLGIGTTSPSTKLSVTAGSGNGISLSATSDTDLNGIYFSDTTGLAGRLEYSHADNYMRVFTNGSERMRIDSSGNVGIGTTSPAYPLEVAGITYSDGLIFRGNSTPVAAVASMYRPASQTIALATNGTERMRIDSSGNLLVGTTNTAPASSGNVAGSSLLAIGKAEHSRDGGVVLALNRKTSDGAIAEFRKDGTTVGSISVTSSTTTYNITSDQRLKDNIVDAPSSSDDIDAIQVRSFDWKADGSHQKYGMIAQELMTVAPEAVSGDPDSDEMMGVDYSKLVPMLIKEIQSLRARVAQLEGAN